VRFAVASQEQDVEIDGGADFSLQQVDIDQLVRLNPVLPAATADYRVNGIPPALRRGGDSYQQTAPEYGHHKE
jgi:hypothetical protein